MTIMIENLIAVFFVISLWSLLFKDTVLFKFGQRTYVGIAVGILVTLAAKTIWDKCIIPLTKGNYIVIIPIVLGILMLFRLSGKSTWVSTYPLVIILGVGFALVVRTAIQTYMVAPLVPILTNHFITQDLYTTLGNIYTWVATITLLTYFLFTTAGLPAKGKQIIETFSKIGRYALLMTLGAAFGNIVLSRNSMFLDRILFILRTFGLVP